MVTTTIGEYQDINDRDFPLSLDELRRWIALDRLDYGKGWEAGYRAGFDAGRDVGYAQAHAERDEQWNAAARRATRIMAGPRHDELEDLRDTPTGAAYEAALARRGGQEYRGGPIDWDTGRPVPHRRRP